MNNSSRDKDLSIPTHHCLICKIVPRGPWLERSRWLSEDNGFYPRVVLSSGGSLKKEDKLDRHSILLEWLPNRPTEKHSRL